TAKTNGEGVSSNIQESENVDSNNDTLIKSAKTETTRQPRMAPAMVSNAMEARKPLKLNSGASSLLAIIQNTAMIRVSIMVTPRKLPKPSGKRLVSLYDASNASVTK